MRYWANAKGAVIYGGTSEIHQTMQGAYALGYREERPFRCPAPTAADLAS
jgi:alkylation response protein AidB-like acyl-CoA dehydrogenase